MLLFKYIAMFTALIWFKFAYVIIQSLAFCFLSYLNNIVLI